MDRLTEEQRRKTMQAVKSKGSVIEQLLQNALEEKGYEIEKNYGLAKGKPDIAFVSLKVAVFCDSDFWHGYNWEERKHDFKSKRDFWWPKIERNIARDEEVTKELQDQGWVVLRFWGHEIKKELEKCVTEIEQTVQWREETLQESKDE